ncbi:MAG: PAS domain S-box protein [bacterium]
MRESEAKFRTITNTAKDAVVMLDNDGNISYWNPAAEEIFGHTSDEAVGKEMHTLMAPTKYHEAYKKGFSVFRETGQGAAIGKTLELEAIRKNGTEFPMEISLSAIQVKGQWHAVGIVRDITERKNAQEELKRAEERYRAIFENAIIGIYQSAPEGRHLSANPALARIYGYDSPEELIASMTDIAKQLYVDPNRRVELFKHSEILNFESQVYRKDGSIIWILENASAICDSKGNILYFVGTVEDITERKRVEEALRRSNVHLLNALRIAKLGNWEYDVAKDLFTFNDEFYALFRTTIEQMGSYTLSSARYAERFVHPEDMSVVADETRKAIESTDPNFSRQLEHRMVYADGEIGHIAVRFQIVKDNEGRTVKTYGVNQDITERKHAEEALREKAALIDLARDAIVVRSLDRRILFWSDGAEVTYGYTAEEALGRIVSELLRSEFPARNLDEIDRIVLEQGYHQDELVHYRKDGRRLNVDIQWALQRNARGEPASILQISRDITERKRAEASLRESEEQLRILFDNLTIGVYRTTPDGQILFANPALIKLLGYSSFDELSTRNLEKGGFHPTYLRSEFKKRLERDGEIRGLESAWTRDDGTTIYVRETARAVRGEDGQIFYYEGTIEDITERKKSEESLEFERRQLLSIFDGMDESVYVIDPATHEILYTNSSLERAFGRKLTGGICHKVFRNSDIPCENCAYPKLIENKGRPLKWELHNSARNRDSAITSQLIRWPDGRDVLLELATDITEKKHAELALRENEEKYRDLVENINDAIYAIDANAIITYASPAIESITGYKPSEVIGLRFIDFLHPDDAHYIIERYQRTLSGRPMEPDEYRILTKSKSVCWIRTSSRPIVQDGQILGIQGVLVNVTERKQAEEALRKSEEKYRTLIEQQREGVVIADPEERFTFCNPAAEEIFGVSHGSLIGRNLREFVSSETLECIRKQTQKRRAGEKSTYEIEIIRPSGEKRHIVILANPWLGEKGEFAGAWGILRDETERKRAETELRFHAKMEMLISSISTDFINLGPDEVDKGVNRALQKIGEFAGADRSYVFLLSDDGTRADNTHEWCAEGIEPQIDKLKGLSADVFAQWAQMLYNFEDIYIPRVADLPEEAAQEKAFLEAQNIKSLIIIPMVYRESLIGFVGFDFVQEEKAWAHDVKASLRILRMAGNAIASVLEHKRTERALRESEAQYRSLIENSNDAIYLLADAKFEIINRRFSEMFGVTPEEVREAGFNFLQLVAPRSQPLIEERRRMTGRGETPPSRYEFTALTKDGKELEVETSVTRIPFRGGTATQGILRDVTDRKRLEGQLRQAQKMEAIGTLAGGIAHDFNNILMAMLGYAEMAKIDLSEGSLAQSDLEEILRAGRRAKDLVRQILAFSRQIEQERKPITLHPVIKEVLRLLRASLPSTIEIRQNIDTNCGVVLADATQIHQVLMNLCSNAHHAMREKGGVLGVELSKIEVDADSARAVPNLREGSYVRLTVSDTGHGMDRATMERIFEPFFTTKGVGEGTGMGLATVHGIVTSHGGAITVYSEPDKGTTFRIYLPRLEAEAPEAMTQVEPIPTGEEHILFVDDEEPLTRLGKQMLERLGYRVTTRTSSVEALEAFRSNPDKFDLIITDQTMPNITGMELADEMMRIRRDIRIILATGFSETVSPDKAKQLGVREYIMKPVAIRELGEIVRRVLDEQKAEV